MEFQQHIQIKSKNNEGETMNIFNKYALLTIGLLMAACSSTVKSPTAAELDPDKVLARIDDLSSRPDWLKESEPLRFESGNVISLGSATIPAEDRVESAYRISENNAKASIASAIEQKLEFIFQNAEEGTQIGAEQARFIGAEASSLITSSIRPHKRYWEKVATTQDSGARVTKLKVYSTVTMPEADFKRAIMNAIRKAEGKKGLSKDFGDKVNQHWDKFTSSLPNEQAQSN